MLFPNILSPSLLAYKTYIRRLPEQNTIVTKLQAWSFSQEEIFYIQKLDNFPQSIIPNFLVYFGQEQE
jgi:hypothetical protein